MKMKYIWVIIIFTLFLGGCKYVPFIKYQTKNGKTDLPSFGKYSYLSGENNSMRAAYDVTKYDWQVEVDPDKRTISGSMEVWFDMVNTQDTLLFDLSSKMKLDSVRCKFPLKYKRKRDLVYVIFDAEVEKDESVELSFYYHGKPPNILNEGPIVWEKDSNENHWFSTQTEGLGVGYLFPCKDLLIDEPEECIITLTVPEGLEAACNGALQSKTTLNDKTTTVWHVDNSINIYNISFNVGDFIKFSIPYIDIEGQQHDLEFYVLKENEAKARKFYAQTPTILAEAEKLFGVYPWWNDGLKFVESTFSAMEHQGCIAMGSEYELDWEEVNTTLMHEIAHEWWGNSLTANDYADIWLHEGLATYAENLINEQLYGNDNYLKYCRGQMWQIMNKRPVLKERDVRYTSWATYADGDIYPKGAMLMHTLRMQMENDDLFFSILKNMLTEFKDSQISTEQFESYFLERCVCDYKVFFDVMLRQAAPPELAYSVFLSDEGKSPTLKYKWTENVPSGYPLKVKFLAGEEVIMLEPSHQTQELALPENVEYFMKPWLSGYFLPEPYK